MKVKKKNLAPPCFYFICRKGQREAINRDNVVFSHNVNHCGYNSMASCFLGKEPLASNLLE